MPAPGSRIPLSIRFWPKVNKTEGCWLWTGATHRRRNANYGSIQLEDQRVERAHRASWLLHFGSIPEGMRVLHRCDTPLCVRPDHLFLGTQAENVADMIAKGRNRALRGSANAASRPGFRRGERNGRARLNAEKVRQIRAMRRDGMEYRDIAANFGVAVPTVQHVVSGKNWGHVT